jgi:hypothetical protein
MTDPCELGLCKFHACNFGALECIPRLLQRFSQSKNKLIEFLANKFPSSRFAQRLKATARVVDLYVGLHQNKRHIFGEDMKSVDTRLEHGKHNLRSHQPDFGAHHCIEVQHNACDTYSPSIEGAIVAPNLPLNRFNVQHGSSKILKKKHNQQFRFDSLPATPLDFVPAGERKGHYHCCPGAECCPINCTRHFKFLPFNDRRQPT